MDATASRTPAGAEGGVMSRGRQAEGISVLISIELISGMLISGMLISGIVIEDMAVSLGGILIQGRSVLRSLISIEVKS